MESAMSSNAGSGDPFHDRALTLRWRSGLTQQELAWLLGVNVGTIQRWEAGLHVPSTAKLRLLIALYLERGVFAVGREAAMAAALWEAARRESPRLKARFDPVWFAGLRPHLPATAPSMAASSLTRHDWGEAPDVAALYGRADELATLAGWVHDEHTHLVAVLGMGGIGKTVLAARLAQQMAGEFDAVYWRSLRNAPLPEEWLAGALGLLSGQQVVPPDGVEARLTLLRDLLRGTRALLVLDNLETVIEPGEPRARYRAGYEGYGQALQLLGESGHRGCLLVTSRETPPEVALLEGPRFAWRVLQLRGLDADESRALLREQHLAGNEAAWEALVERYGGNGLALRLVGETIAEAFAGDITTFLAEGEAVFGDIRRLLDSQVGRLSAMERSVLSWLAIEREPVGFATLASDLEPVGRGVALAAVEALRRRSLLERGGQGSTVTLQPVVLEHVTNQLVGDVYQEIMAGQPALLASHALVQATARDYVRRSQERLIAQPLLEALARAMGGATQVEARLKNLLSGWRDQAAAQQGYGPGNVVNLLRLLRGDLRGMDLAELRIRQAYLQEVEAQDARLARAHLTESVLGEAFYNVFSAALSADGAYLAAGTIDSEIRLWRVADRRPLLSIRPHTGLVFGLALSADGRLLASGGLDGTIKLWEVPSGGLLATLQGHTGQVPGVALSGDGRLLASGGLDGLVKLWETEPAGWEDPETPSADSVGRVASVPLRTASHAKGIPGRAHAPRHLLATMQGHTGIIHGVALSGDGRLLASAGQDGTVKLWEATPASGSPGRLLQTLEGHAGGAWCVALAADGCLLAAGCQDGTIKLWESASGRLLATLQGHTGTVHSIRVSGDGRLVVSGDYDGMVKLWEAQSGLCLATMPAHTGGVFGVALSEDGRLAASGGLDGAVKLWEAPSGRLLATVQGHTGIVYGVARSADERLIASGGDDGTVRLWDAASGRLLAALQQHTGIVFGVALSDDGRLVVSGGEDGTLNLWDTHKGCHRATLRGHSGWVRSVALSADGRLVASGGQDGSVRLWDVASGRQRAVLLGHNGLVFALAMSADGRLLASGAYDGTVKLWDTASGQLRATLSSHGGLVFALALSADGGLLASGGEDTLVRLWEAAPASGSPGRLLATFEGHAAPIFGLAVSGDGQCLASSGIDGTIRLWATAGGDCLQTLRSHAGIVYAVTLSDDGRRIVSGGDDGVVTLWDVPADARLRELRPDRRYERMDIAGLTGITEAQRQALIALGAVEGGT
jgi:WD40 repeat protein/transcriptional regulator with XRE-family HTH domain